MFEQLLSLVGVLDLCEQLLGLDFFGFDLLDYLLDVFVEVIVLLDEQVFLAIQLLEICVVFVRYELISFFFLS